MDIFTFDSLDDLFADDYFEHYGTPRHSGRYPWGSGENPYQHEGDFYGRVNQLKKSGLTEKEIADSMGLSIKDLRDQYSISRAERRSDLIASAKAMRSDGYTNAQIAEKLGLAGESSVRSLLNEDAERRMNTARATADILKATVDEHGMTQVGTGVETYLGCSENRLSQALTILKNEGYEVYSGRISQLTNPEQKTTIKVLCPPGTEHKDIFKAFEENGITMYDPSDDYISYDGGETYKKSFVYPESMDSSRLQICYAEDGGKQKDGLVEIRRGVADLSLGRDNYAQVRILVDGTHYIKGMAVYSDDLPPGVDVRFNTNKSKDVSKMDVLKEITNDPDNPFGSTIKEKGGQSYWYDDDGNEHLSLINKRASEGDWQEWKDELSAQFLSKQPKKLLEQQLGIAEANKQAEYEDICLCTNPTVKKRLLASFAEDCDSAAVHLNAAALPRQKYQVILPMTTIKDTEVYAPNYNNGEKVALIRYPHAGTFEIPILTVNNKYEEGDTMIGRNSADAIGISAAVADRLSGADFDGDTVMVIPCNSDSSNIRIVSTPKLKELENFDPKVDYAYHDGIKLMTKSNTQTEMGVISNLITDMTLKGAKEEEVARAVKHSMVVIDAYKHKLDYQRSYKDNNIDQLKKLYQQHTDDDGYGGAATLVSRAKSETRVPKTIGDPWIDPDTGKLTWEGIDPRTGEYRSKIDTSTYAVAKIVKRTKEEPNATIHINAKGKVYVQPDGETNWVSVKTKTTDKNGDPTVAEGDRVYSTYEEQRRTKTSTKMAETDDAMTLVSDLENPTELAYASYANKMKALANQARKEMLNTGKITYSATAKANYQKEVDSLNAKLALALRNKPRERQATIIANSRMAAIKESNPSMTKSEIKKRSQQELTRARESVNAHRQTIDIDDREWEAIQAGAINETTLSKILNNTDIDKIRQRAMPYASNELPQFQQDRIKRLASSGYTNEEIASMIGCSTSTVFKYSK